MESKEDAYAAIVKIIQEIVYPTSIFFNQELMQKVRNNKKGYIQWDYLFQCEKVVNALEEHDMLQEYYSNKELLCSNLMKYIKEKSKILWANVKGVRLLKYPISEGKTPVYIQNYDYRDNNEHFKNLLLSLTKIQDIRFIQKEKIAVVYAEQPQNLHQINGLTWKNEKGDINIMEIIKKEDILREQEHSSAKSCREQTYKTDLFNELPLVVTKKPYRKDKQTGEPLKFLQIEEIPVNFKNSDRKYKECKEQGNKLVVEFDKVKEMLQDPREYDDE